MSITALPTPPLRADPTNFAVRADTFLAALPTFVTEANTLVSTVNSGASAAATSATNAATSASTASTQAAAAAVSATVAVSAAGATQWVSGTTYAIGDARWSPITKVSYRRITAGAGTTDPSADATNWGVIGSSYPLQTSSTGSVQLPSGTTAQRDSTPSFGATRANSTLTQTEWWNGAAWVSMGGGATGAPGNNVFVENDQVVTADYTLTTGKNASSAGPITINTGVLVTVPTGAVWTIV